MSFSFKGGRWVLFILSMSGLSCSSDPETFCASKVEQICKVLADCCNGSAKFDMEGCELQVSAGCEASLQVEGVHAGDYVFDEGAANTCYGKLETCEDINSPAEPDKDQFKACRNALTGHRPPGAACQQAFECEKSGGDYPTCHGGQVCAKAILSEDECSFSFETNELMVCVPGKYCDIPEKDIDPSTSPTKQALEFKGSCKSPLGKGKKCIPDGMEFLPCEDGLFCQLDITNLENSTCQTRKAKGEVCNDSNECKEGLFCDFDGMGSTCNDDGGDADPGLFCFTPPDCGDGSCDEPYENEENCAMDCSDCGDGFCDFGGDEPATCPADCCGDGFCDQGETPEICAADCSP